MAERESRRTDRHAVIVGALTFGAVSVFVSGALCGLVYLAEPVVRGLSRGVPFPDFWHLGVVGAGVGVLSGWARLRGARRYVAAGGPDSIASTGSRALDAARAEHARRGAPGPEGTRPIQRWSDDLLHGCAVLPVAEGLSGEPHRAVAGDDANAVQSVASDLAVPAPGRRLRRGPVS